MRTNLTSHVRNGVMAVLVLVGGGIGGALAQSQASAGTVTASLYAPMRPVRVFDSRTGDRLHRAIYVPVPVPLDATAVAVNITMTDTVGPGYLTAWDGNGARPEVSLVNTSGQDVANFAIIPVSKGRIAVHVSTPSHVIVDLMGYTMVRPHVDVDVIGP